jgi:hypothetical protein
MATPSATLWNMATADIVRGVDCRNGESIIDGDSSVSPDPDVAEWRDSADPHRRT